MQPPMIGAAIEQVFAHHAFAPRQVYAALNTAHHVFVFRGRGTAARAAELVLVRLHDQIDDGECDDEQDELQVEIALIRSATLNGVRSTELRPDAALARGHGLRAALSAFYTPPLVVRSPLAVRPIDRRRLRACCRRLAGRPGRFVGDDTLAGCGTGGPVGFSNAGRRLGRRSCVRGLR